MVYRIYLRSELNTTKYSSLSCDVFLSSENKSLFIVKLRKLWTAKNFQECWLCGDQSQWSSGDASKPQNHKLTTRGFIKHRRSENSLSTMRACRSVESWLNARCFFISTRKIIKRIKLILMKQNVKQNKVQEEQITVAKLGQEKCKR